MGGDCWDYPTLIVEEAGDHFISEEKSYLLS
jgi:hypothetical protein